MGCHTLQREGGALFKGHFFGQRDELTGIERRVLTVTPEMARIGDPVAYTDAGHTGNDRFHHPRRLQSGNVRELHRIGAPPLINVDKVQACCLYLDQCLPCSGYGLRFGIRVFKNIGTAIT